MVAMIDAITPKSKDASYRVIVAAPQNRQKQAPVLEADDKRASCAMRYCTLSQGGVVQASVRVRGKE
jgi:hypothetical protein